MQSSQGISRQGTIVEQDDRQKIEIYVQCRGLADMDTFSKSDPQVILYIKINNQWVEHQRTEIIWDNLNPNFTKTFKMDFVFEQQQELKFKVIDVDNAQVTSYDFIGDAYSSLGAIVGAKNSTVVLDLIGNNNKKNGKLILRGETVEHCSTYLEIQLAANKKFKNFRGWFSGTSSPFLRFFKIKEGSNGKYLVYTSEVIAHNLNPVFKKFEINIFKLCGKDHHTPIHIEMWDHRSNGTHTFMGSGSITLHEIFEKNIRSISFFKKNSKEEVGGLAVSYANLVEKPEFIDYIDGGTQLNLLVAVDYTGSNGIPTAPSSLHYIGQSGYLNPYQKAIKSCGDILINYDYDKLVPCYGFGAKTRYPYLQSNTVQHCFPLNGNSSNPDQFQVDGILESYKYALQNVELSGPTYFNPIISESMKQAEEIKQQNLNQYIILLILTDGVIHDMQQTISSLVDCAYLPLSIIIVGIGNADFKDMEILDGDDGLWDQRGRKAQRDLVQFVPFNKFGGNPIKLAEEVLEEVPRQLVEYMRSQGKQPGESKQGKQFNFDEINPQNVNFVIPQQQQQIPQQFMEHQLQNAPQTERGYQKTQTYNPNTFSPQQQGGGRRQSAQTGIPNMNNPQMAQMQQQFYQQNPNYNQNNYGYPYQ